MQGTGYGTMSPEPAKVFSFFRPPKRQSLSFPPHFDFCGSRAVQLNVSQHGSAPESERGRTMTSESSQDDEASLSTSLGMSPHRN